MLDVDQIIEDLGIVLPAGAGPAGNYTTAVRTGNLVFLSGKAPLAVDGKVPKGRLGGEYSTSDGYQLARSACIDLLATLKHSIGSLNNVVRIVELHGSLCTVAEFEDHAQVLDGASDLLVQIFGAAGLHARSVIGVYSLRNGVPLTVKATIEVKSDYSNIGPGHDSLTN